MRRRYLELVVVRWIDSETEIGWEEFPKEDQPFGENLTVGFLIHQDLERYVIAGDYDPENDHFNRVIRIPRCCVKKLRSVTVLPLGLKK